MGVQRGKLYLEKNNLHGRKEKGKQRLDTKESKKSAMSSKVCDKEIAIKGLGSRGREGGRRNGQLEAIEFVKPMS